MLVSPLLYVIAGDAVQGGMKAHDNGVVRGVVHAKNAAETNRG
jgi:hypothetical protein